MLLVHRGGRQRERRPQTLCGKDGQFPVVRGGGKAWLVGEEPVEAHAAQGVGRVPWTVGVSMMVMKRGACES